MKAPKVLAGALAAALLLTACSSAGSSSGDEYPSDEVRLLVPYTAGGPTDIAARALGRYMERDLGQTVVVENLPGASGATAYQELLASQPDGYTLSMTALPTAVLNYLFNDVGYTRESFESVGVVTRVPSAIVVPAESPHQDVESLFAAAKANPGSVKVGTPGATNTHAAETKRISQLYDVPLTVVPFEGNSEVQTALLGGNVTAGFVNVSQDMLPAIESGEIRALAVGTAERLKYVDAPTLSELGYPELTQSTTTFGLIAPEGTPDGVVGRLEGTMRSALQDPKVVKSLDQRYVPPKFLGGQQLTELFAQTEKTFQGVAGG